MSKTSITNMTTTVIYNDDETHRYLLRKEWDSTKPTAEIIMLYPSYADTITVDHTTMFVLHNLERLDYGSVNIVNLFSCMNQARKTRDIDEDNIQYITEYAEKSDVIIFATGTGGDGNKTVLAMQREVLNALEPYRHKLKCIADKKGKKFYHPLCPTVRNWNLTDFDYSELRAFKTDGDVKVIEKDVACSIILENNTSEKTINIEKCKRGRKKSHAP